MRITNRIIQNNSLTNINTNKTLQDKLSTMISTNKKIARPSEDPIIALRSLRLRTSVSQTDQYVNKNVEDAKSWLNVTEDAIDTLSDIISDIRNQYTKGTSDTLTSSDREIIAESLNAFAAEVYNTGNADFAGRSVFTGYRTDTTLTFQKQEDVSFTIFEDQTTADLDTITYVHKDVTEQAVTNNTITRIRLSYSNCDDDTAPTLYLNGSVTATTPAIMSVNGTGASNPYDYVLANPGQAVFIPETGEILVGSGLGDTDSIENFEVSYEKSEWVKGDLRPQHYFRCEDHTAKDADPSAETIQYNFTSPAAGEIEYNVGVNQSIRINTTANECYTHDIVRDIEDVMNALNEVQDIEKEITKLKSEYKAINQNDAASLAAKQVEIDAAEKAKTFLDKKLHNLFSKGISNADKYLDANNVALTNCGTRSKRLDLIENRLDTQLSTLQELKSENEDADVAETAIKLSSAGYAYDAALMATSKIIKENLLNYI